MAFASFSEFWAMGGYGFFVWLSFGTGVGLMLWLWGQGIWSRRQLRRQVQKELQRQQRIKQYRQQQESGQ
ncbi:Heme exporter protein D [Saliniradius amylolyticus]|uniref:Heme exporter protein D n=1 Tax=Saliniradius amylolyticus TaxID=2183582 RepID=A0A2S2E0Y5_9ALTE|nr:heme exporter protein CcmD [Saliniradius amylolyticus]AWL11308.1 Heme exporter protein D [Saliniradius amylolyticus]